jgi:hypothetical protein
MRKTGHAAFFPFAETSLIQAWVNPRILQESIPIRELPTETTALTG